MPGELRRRCEVLEITDVQWFYDAYTRAALRIEDEQKKGDRKNLERLGRRLQALYDVIEKDLEAGYERRMKARAAAIAINHAISDRGFPKTLCQHWEGDDPAESA